MTTILKQEQLDTELEPFLLRFFPTNNNGTNHRRYYTTLPHEKRTKNLGSNNRQFLCSHPNGCLDDDWGKLLNKTSHTNETIRIVNRLYELDFAYFGYHQLLQPNETRAMEVPQRPKGLVAQVSDDDQPPPTHADILIQVESSRSLYNDMPWMESTRMLGSCLFVAAIGVKTFGRRW
jgi:hypothetical protein